MHSNAEALQDGFTTAYRDRGEALLLDRVDDDVDPIELAVEVDDGANQPVRHVSQDADVLLEDVIQIRIDQVRPVADRIDIGAPAQRRCQRVGTAQKAETA
jgi:hypothetical protein